MHQYHFYNREGFRIREWREGKKIFIEVENNALQGWWSVVRGESSKKKAIQMLNAFIDRNKAIRRYQE